MWDKVKDFFDGRSAEPYADEKTKGDLATREVTAGLSGEVRREDLVVEDEREKVGQR